MAPIKEVPSTIEIDQVVSGSWDIVVIGAGLAGALCARQSALQGCKVLLVDQAKFPRWKVCGCCLNGAAIDVLARSGLRELIMDCNAIPLKGLELSSGHRVATFEHKHGVVVSRERLDSALIHAAIEAGVEFIHGVKAQIDPIDPQQVIVHLRNIPTHVSITVPIAIAATGLGARVFSDCVHEYREVATSSRVGLGAVMEDCPSEVEPGVIYMHCNSEGYVGLVRLEDNRLDIAAALDADAIKRSRGPAELITKILKQSSARALAGIRSASWQGTPKLTQRRANVAEHGCLFIGDAAGYVEPFTGEGMAWALACGYTSAALAARAINANETERVAEQWKKHHREMIVRRSRACKLISLGLRYPIVPQFSVRALSVFPWLAQPIVRSMNAPFDLNALPDFT
ncbi:MAG: NAD(P)/FAD-dependent oxidoreductase [Planctomycetota bacterium]|nr:NAD(P)/FAD-dependent oxidoreductase [Planctomycetota bacterium]